MVKVVALFGAPGSGKGTISQILGKHFNFVHISTGDLLREEIAKRSEIGIEVEKLVTNGILVKDELITKMLKARVMKDDCKVGFTLDGYPRTLHQLELLESDILPNLNISLYLNIQIIMEEETIIKRITGRYSCGKCGHIYNDFGVQPKVKDVCDVCGSKEFIRRKDDNLETVTARLKIFKEQTFSIIEHYKRTGSLLSIRGDIEEDKLVAWLKSALKE